MRRGGRPMALLALGVALVAVVAGCGDDGGGDPDARTPRLAPTYVPETGTSVTTTGGSPAPTSTARPGGPASTEPPVGTTGGSAPPPPATPTLSAAVADPVGDLTPSPLDPPPPWADLAGGQLTRAGDDMAMRVRLGGAPPSKAPDANRTMNVAWFADVDGDGHVDYEVWTTLADDGWGSAWYDNPNGTARFAGRSGVTVVVEGAELVLRFPWSHVGRAERFRWSLASEWGRYEVIATPAAARDDAPDNDAAVAFPG